MFWLKQWTPTLIALIAIIGNVVVGARWIQQIEDRVEIFEKHIDDSSRHMSLEKKIEFFITRKEFDAHANRDAQSMVEIRATLERIDDKVTRLYEARLGNISSN